MDDMLKEETTISVWSLSRSIVSHNRHDIIDNLVRRRLPGPAPVVVAVTQVRHLPSFLLSMRDSMVSLVAAMATAHWAAGA